MYSRENPSLRYKELIGMYKQLHREGEKNLGIPPGETFSGFSILPHVERIKELITYGELNISEIAWKMNYSSVAHLSNQFKKMTGLTPTHFKQLKHKRRSPIEEVGN